MWHLSFLFPLSNVNLTFLNFDLWVHFLEFRSREPLWSTILREESLLRRGPPSSPKAGPFERRFYHFETSLGKFCTFLTKYGVFRFGLELAKMPENGIFCFSRAYLYFSYVGILGMISKMDFKKLHFVLLFQKYWIDRWEIWKTKIMKW